MLMEQDPLPAQARAVPCSSGESVDLPDLHPNVSPHIPSTSNTMQMPNEDYYYKQSPAVKRFHQTFGTGPNAAATIGESQSGSKASRNYAKSWLNSHYDASVVPYTTSLSNTPSMMSLTSFASNVSALSVNTELSIITDIDTNEMMLCLPPNNVVQYCNASTSSLVENIEPNSFQIMENYLCHLIEKLKENDEKSILEALYSVHEIARTRRFIYCNSIESIVSVLDNMFRVLFEQTRSQKIRNVILSTLYEMTLNPICLEAFNAFIRVSEGLVIWALCQFLNSNEKYSRFVINTLHTLFSHKLTCKLSKYCAQRDDVLLTMMSLAESPNCTYKQIVLDALRLILRSSNLKMLFKQHKGMEMCLKLVETEPEEKVLYRSILLMAHLLNNVEMCKHFVNCGGVQIISRYLEHPSPKLVQNIAKCLALVSDSPKLAAQNIDIALQRVTQILGSRDMDLVLYATGFLANVQSNNIKALIFLHDIDAINNLMQLLYACMNSDLILNERKKTLEVVENVLLALSKLTSNYDDIHSYAVSACLQVMTSCTDAAKPIIPASESINSRINAMLDMLAGSWTFIAPIVFIDIIAIDNINAASRVVLILNQIIEKIHNIAIKFENIYDSYRRADYAINLNNLLFTAVGELHKHNNSNTMDTKAVDRLKQLFRRSIMLLLKLAKSSTYFRHQMGTICCSKRNPLMLLPYLDVDLQENLVKFFNELTDGFIQLNQALATNEDIVRLLHDQTLYSSNPEIVHYSNVILSKIGAIF